MCDLEVLTLQLRHARAIIEHGFALHMQQRILAKKLNDDS